MFRGIPRHVRNEHLTTSFGTLTTGAFLKQFGGGTVTLSNFADRDDIAQLTLDHPEKKNALTGSMIVALRESMREVAANSGELRPLVLRLLGPGTTNLMTSGAGGTFCAGADLEFVRQIANTADGMRLSQYMSDTLWEMAQLPLPVIAVLERNCLGGAAELALAADIRVAHTNARMAFVHARMGISPGFGSVRFLEDVVGRARAIELLASAELLSADGMKESGIVSTLFDSEKVLADYVGKFTLNSAAVTRAAKCVVRDTMDRRSWVDRKKGEHQHFMNLWGSKEHRDALSRDRRPLH